MVFPNYPGDFSVLKTDPSGISDEEATSRLQQYGLNKLIDKKQKSPLKILWQQFAETMVIILIGAAVLSAFLGKTTEAIAIFAIVLLFGLLGFFQEYRAENAMAALNRMVVPTVRVRRNGILKEIRADELVPGDIVEFEAGNVVPADIRLLETFSLKIQEAALTGESEPVEKNTGLLKTDDLPLGDRKNMAYMGTVVSNGRGVISAALIFVTGLMMGEAWDAMFLTAVSVAVAVIPEGLPAVVTITLAISSQRMLKRNALIRKLPAVETLGSVTAICSDKTGTLTQNKMTVTIWDIPNITISLEDLEEDSIQNTTRVNELDFVLTASVLCNDGILEKEENNQEPEKVIGDPTETALLVAAARRHIFKQDLLSLLPRTNEIPFDSNRKRMSTLHSISGTLHNNLTFLEKASHVLITKGAPDSLLSVTTSVWVNGVQEPLTQEWQERILKANTNLARQGIRVLGFAFRLFNSEPDKAGQEQDLTFVGLAGMIDPPRQEVKAAVAKCKAAGMHPIMITGDHPLTAGAIAAALEIDTEPQAVSGEMLQKVEGPGLQQLASKTSVYARVSPEDKLRIVDALQKNGHVVAMTGDGVNDSPALKKADIGVAMGITGTDVAKEAADMVLLDDNFSTIVAAVEEGRVTFANLRRFIKFSPAGNIGKVFLCF